MGSGATLGSANVTQDGGGHGRGVVVTERGVVGIAGIAGMAGMAGRCLRGAWVHVEGAPRAPPGTAAPPGC